MNQRELLFAIKFRTQSSAAIKKAAKDIKGAAAAAKGADVAAKKASVSARAMGASFTSAGARMRAFGVKARTSFSRLRTEIFRAQTALFALGVAFGLTAVVSQIKKFELAMAKVRAIASKGNTILAKTTAQFRLLTITARRLGETTQFTATQVADALRLLAQAGFNANEAVQAVEGTLNLAIAASTDLATATTITANTIRGFNLAATESARVADILTAATQNSNTTIELLGEAMKFAAPAALAAGQSIETTAAALSVLADAGLKGTLAGTGLRRVIVGLLNPVAKAKVAFKGLNLDIKDLTPGALDATGHVIQLNDIIQTLSETAFGAREAFAAFGLRGGPAALVLVNTERLRTRFKELTKIIDESDGRARAFRDTITDTLFGSLKLLNSRIESLALSQGVLAVNVRKVVDFMADMVAGLNRTLVVTNKAQRASKEFAETLRTVGKAMFQLIKWAPELIAVFIGIKIALWAMGAAASATALGMGTLTAVMAPFIAVLGGIAIAIAGIGLFKLYQQVTQNSKNMVIAAESAKRWEDGLISVAKTIAELDKLDLSEAERVAQIGILNEQATKLKAELGFVRHEIELAGAAILKLQNIKPRSGGKAGPQSRRVENARRRKELEEQLVVHLKILASRQAELNPISERNRLEQNELKFLSKMAQLEEEIGRASQAISEGLQGTLFSVEGKQADTLEKLNRELTILDKKAQGTKKSLEEASVLEFRESSGFYDTNVQDNLDTFIASQKESLATAEAMVETLNKQLIAEPENAVVILKELELRKIIVDTIRDQGVEAAKKGKITLAATQAEIEATTLGIRVKKLDIKETARQKAVEHELLKFRQKQISELKDEIRYQGLSANAQRRTEEGLKLVTQAFEKGIPVQREWIDQLNEQITAVEEFEKASNTLAQGWRDASDQIIEDMRDFRTQGAEIFESMFDDLNDKLLEFMETGKFNAKEFFDNVRRETLKFGIKQVTGRILEGIRGKKEDPAIVAAELIKKQLESDRESLERQLESVSGKDTQQVTAQLEAVNRTLEAMAAASGVSVPGASTGTKPPGGDKGAFALPEHKAGGKGGLASILAPLSGIEGALPPGFKLADSLPGGAGAGLDAVLTGLPKLAGMLPSGISGATSGIMPTAGAEEDSCCKMIVAEIVIQKTVLGVKLDEIKQAILVSGGAAGPLQDKVSMLSNPGIPAGDGSGQKLQNAAGMVGQLFNGVESALGVMVAEHGGLTSLPRLASGTSRAASLGTGALSKLGLGANEIPAVLHPNEAVIPLTRGGLIPIGPGGDVALPFGRKIGTQFGSPVTDMGMRAALTGRKTPAGLAAGLGATRAAFSIFKDAARGAEGFQITDAGIITDTGLTLPVKPGGGVDLSSMFELFGEEDFEGFSELVAAGSGAGGFFSAITGGVTSILGSIGAGIGALDSVGTNGAGGNISSAISIVGSIVSIVDSVMKGTKKPKQKTKRLRTLGFGDFLKGEGGDKFRGYTREETSYFNQERNAQIAARDRKARAAGAEIAERRFAEGGVVNRPTRALIGEAGVPEAVVPLPNGRAIPVQLGGAGGQQPVSEVMNVTYNIMTPDADSFRSAQPQILTATGEELRRASHRALEDDTRGA